MGGPYAVICYLFYSVHIYKNKQATRIIQYHKEIGGTQTYKDEICVGVVKKCTSFRYFEQEKT